jgi:hypothetical protein
MRLPQQSPPVARHQGTLLSGRMFGSSNVRRDRTCSCKKVPNQKRCKVVNAANHCDGLKATCGAYPECDCRCERG